MALKDECLDVRDVDTSNVVLLLAAPCPFCGQTVQLGADDGVHALFHAIPACEEFENMPGGEFLAELTSADNKMCARAEA